MAVNLETTLKRPDPHKRDRIAESLRKMAGELSPGDRLPSAMEMRHQFGVAAGTVEAAVELLRQEGLVERRRGSGTFVARRTPVAHPGKVKTGLIAVLASGKFPYIQNAVEQLSAQAPGQGMRIVCHYGHYESDPERALQDALELEALQPAGFVLTFAHLAPVARVLLERGHPAVVIGLRALGETPLVPCVDGDHEYGARLAACRLLDLGHRRLLFVHGFARSERLWESRRWEGHRRALQEAGIDSISSAYFNFQQPDYAEIVRLFHGPDAPTGVVAWNDDEAVTLMSLLRQTGLRVPDDVSVIGYGNVPLGEHAHPALETIDQHMEVQVRYVFDLLKTPLSRLSQGSGPTTSVTPTLLRRHSCAAPPVSALSPISLSPTKENES